METTANLCKPGSPGRLSWLLMEYGGIEEPKVPQRPYAAQRNVDRASLPQGSSVALGSGLEYVRRSIEGNRPTETSRGSSGGRANPAARSRDRADVDSCRLGRRADCVAQLHPLRFKVESRVGLGRNAGVQALACRCRQREPTAKMSRGGSWCYCESHGHTGA